MRGFSQTHVAGTGGASRYANFSLYPFAGSLRINGTKPFFQPPVGDMSLTENTEQSASVGVYECRMRQFDIDVAIAATRHCGIHRWRWCSGGEAGMILDAASVLQHGVSPSGETQWFEAWDSEGESIGGFVQILSDTRLIGRSDFRGGWGHDKPYSLYFSLETSAPMSDFQLANAHGVVPLPRIGAAVAGSGCRVAVSFGEIPEVEVRVGVSFVSVAQADRWLRDEARGKTFDQLVSAAREEWAERLGHFHVAGGTEAQRSLFFNCLYRLHCLPTDLGVDEENPFWTSGVRQFTDFYCLWDSIRNANSFFHLFDPDLSRDFCNALLDTAEQTGWLPDAHIAMQPAFMQSACSGDILFREAQVKGIKGVNYARALHHLRRNAEVVPPDPLVQGRYLAPIQQRGFLATGDASCVVSREVEYFYNDWCIGKLAGALGETKVAADYDQKSQKIWDHWRSDLSAFAPKLPDGSWDERYDPAKTHQRSWMDPYCYESNGHCWTLCALHQIPELMEKFGGPEGFIRHLDNVWDCGWFEVKETRMHLPALYTFAGRPDRAGERMLDAITHEFTNDERGFSGNEDMGCTAAFYLWGAMGLYPIMGQPIYILTPPMLDEIRCAVRNATAVLQIRATRQGSGRYIVGARLNGKSLERAWLRHVEITNGGELEFDLSDTPVNWGQEMSPPLD